MNHRIPAIALVFALGLTACGADQPSAPDAAVETPTAHANGADSPQVDSDDAPAGPGQDDADQASSQTEGQAPISRTSTDDRRLKSSVLGAAVEHVTQTSARFEAVMTVVSEDPELPGTFDISFSGGYDLPNRATEIEMDFSGLLEMVEAEASPAEAQEFEEFAAIFAEPMRMISIGDESWVQGGFFTMFGAEPGMWLAMESDNSEAAVQDLAGFGTPLSPTEFIDEFEDANATVTELGAETIRGTETTHYLAEIDLTSLAELADELSPEEQAELEESLAEFGDLDTLAIHFWIDADDLLRRMQLSVDMTNMPDNDGLASMTMTFDIFDYGEDLGITAPDPDSVLDEADLGFDS